MEKLKLFAGLPLILFFIVCFSKCSTQVSNSSNNIDSLYKVVQEGLNKSPNNQYYYKAQGDILVLKGLIKEAIESYNTAINIHPQYIDAISARGVAYYKDSNYDNALSDFNFCLNNSDSIYSEFYYNRALVYHDLEKYQEALSDYNKAIAINNNYSDAYFNKGILYMDIKDYASAIKLFTDALIIKTNDAVILANRGYAYYQNTQYDLSINDFSKALSIDSTIVVSYKWLGFSYYKLGDNDKACVNLNRARSLNDDEVEKLMTLICNNN